MNSNLTKCREIRKFGIIGTIFFVILFSVAIWRDKTLVAYFFGALTVLSFGFILMPIKLKPIYVAWLKIAQFIGSKITILILTVLFFLVITPTALLKRVFGGRPLPLKPDSKAETYWITRLEPAQPRERFLKRF
jgi:hypothetical protein